MHLDLCVAAQLSIERVRSHISTLLRSLIFVRCWIKTRWSKWRIFIKKATGQLTS
ncbi:hypothetical protein LINPERHAP2_LOCUS33594 [Linum perenne]